jgi:hypothetical protein
LTPPPYQETAADLDDEGMTISRLKDLIPFIPPDIAILLIGPPGIGKTDTARQMAKEANEAMKADKFHFHMVDMKTDPAAQLSLKEDLEKMKTHLEIIDLNAHLPEDLSGYPRPCDDEQTVIRLPEEWMRNLSYDAIGDEPGILVLDDISQTGPSMQAAVFRVCLERKAGATNLGTNVRVILTANRRSDRAGAGTILSPLVGRCWAVPLIPDLESWLAWASNEGVDKRIRGFLRFKPNYLSRLPANADEFGRFASPRGWAFLSRCLRAGLHDTDIFELARCFISSGPANEFAAFCRYYGSIPDPLKALKDPSIVGVIRDTSKLIAVLMSLMDTAVRIGKMEREAVHAVCTISDDNTEMACAAFQHGLNCGMDLDTMADAVTDDPRAERAMEALITALGLQS